MRYVIESDFIMTTTADSWCGFAKELVEWCKAEDEYDSPYKPELMEDYAKAFAASAVMLAGGDCFKE